MDTMCIWNEYICLSSEPFARIRVHMDAPPDQLRDDPGSGLERRRLLAYGRPARLDRRHCAEPRRQDGDLSAKKIGDQPMDYDALIAKLSRELDAMAEFLDTSYTTESPEVQDVPVLTLNLNIGEVRLIREMLRHCPLR